MVAYIIIFFKNLASIGVYHPYTTVLSLFAGLIESNVCFEMVFAYFNCSDNSVVAQSQIKSICLINLYIRCIIPTTYLIAIGKEHAEFDETDVTTAICRKMIDRHTHVFGTVQVEKLHSIEHFSHVMHIGSTVRGEIREDKDALDAVAAVLPAGTLSGAPKIRACQIIGELENNKRGIYGGAIGYIDFSGNMDTCIAIRIAYKKNGKVFVRSGAGIVADSVPEKEYEECLNKAAAVINALKQAEEVDL